MEGRELGWRAVVVRRRRLEPVSDDSLTSLVQPSVTVFTARGFIPYTIEVEEDGPASKLEMSRILSVGYDELLLSTILARLRYR